MNRETQAILEHLRGVNPDAEEAWFIADKHWVPTADDPPGYLGGVIRHEMAQRLADRTGDDPLVAGLAEAALDRVDWKAIGDALRKLGPPHLR